MPFDFISFATDYGLNWVDHGHKHCRPGWVQTPCPFCTGNPGHHLGYNTNGGFFTCWRCGFHSNLEVVKHSAEVDWTEARVILNEYNNHYIDNKGHKPKKNKRITHVKLPQLTGPLKKQHKTYLRKRGYDPDKLANEWELLGTGPVGPYKHRIIAPITFNGTLVSYQGRDYTGKSSLRYKACKQENELIDHKNILYGIDKVKGLKCVLVEGITDVWRLGPGAIATFGIKYKPSQFQLIWERFNTVYIMFDDDPQAQEQAEILAYELTIMFDINVEICLISGDPGDLSQKKADRYMRELLG